MRWKQTQTSNIMLDFSKPLEASFKVSQFQVGAKPKQKQVYRDVSKRLKECCMNYDPEHKLKFLRNIAHNLTLHK